MSLLWPLHCSGHCPKIFQNICEMLGEVAVEPDEEKGREFETL